MDPLTELLAVQDGVVSRRQLLELGMAPHDIRRRLRRRDWVPLHPGVYLDHTGEPSWQQRAWGAVLSAAPAALVGHSALRAHEGPGRRVTEDTEDTVIHVGVASARHILTPEGVRITRMNRLSDRVLWNTSPPRQRYDDAVLDVAAQAASDFAALELLSRGVQSRRTTATRMLELLAQRPRSSRRQWLVGVLRDISRGTCSVLEHGYLTRVEQPHGLDLGRRQVQSLMSRGPVYRDVVYDNGQIIELDGRLFHDSTTQRDRDLDRDLEAATLGASTVRVGWGQVFERACWTAQQISLLVHVVPRPCSATCAVRDLGRAS